MQPRGGGGGGARRLRGPVLVYPGDDPDEPGLRQKHGGGVGGGAADIADRFSLRWLLLALVGCLLLLHGLLTLQRINERTNAIQAELRDTERLIGSIAKHRRLTVNVDAPVPTLIAANRAVPAATPAPGPSKPATPPASGLPGHPAPTTPRHPAAAPVHATFLATNAPEDTFDAEGEDWQNGKAGLVPAPGGTPAPTRDPRAPVLEHHAPFTRAPAVPTAPAGDKATAPGGLPLHAGPTPPMNAAQLARERSLNAAKARQTGNRNVRTKQPPPPTDVIGRAGDITDKTIAAMRAEALKADDLRAEPWLTERPKNVDGTPKFRIAVLTLNAKNVQRNGRAGPVNKRPDWMHGHSYHNKNEYCKRWGYDFIVEDNAMVDRSRDVAWSKIPIFRKWLPHYDYIMWMDMDAFFMRYEIPLESLVLRDEAKDIIIAKDFHGINFGVFFFKSTQFAAELMELMWNAPRHWWEPWQEQSALMKLTDKKFVGQQRADELNKHFLYIPQRDMNAYPQHFSYGNLISHYRDGDFIVHFPNCKAFPMCQTIIGRFYAAACKYNDIGPEPAQVPPFQHPATDPSKRADWAEMGDQIIANAAAKATPPPTPAPPVRPQTIRVVTRRPLPRVHTPQPPAAELPVEDGNGGGADPAEVDPGQGDALPPPPPIVVKSKKRVMGTTFITAPPFTGRIPTVKPGRDDPDAGADDDDDAPTPAPPVHHPHKTQKPKKHPHTAKPHKPVHAQPTAAPPDDDDGGDDAEPTQHKAAAAKKHAAAAHKKELAPAVEGGFDFQEAD